MGKTGGPQLGVLIPQMLRHFFRHVFPAHSRFNTETGSIEIARRVGR
jgi:hypothetical protein